jgi:hypothetical protein
VHYVSLNPFVRALLTTKATSSAGPRGQCYHRMNLGPSVNWKNYSQRTKFCSEWEQRTIFHILTFYITTKTTRKFQKVVPKSKWYQWLVFASHTRRWYQQSVWMLLTSLPNTGSSLPGPWLPSPSFSSSRHLPQSLGQIPGQYLQFDNRHFLPHSLPLSITRLCSRCGWMTYKHHKGTQPPIPKCRSDIKNKSGPHREL